MIRVLLVDDHRSSREALAFLLNQQAGIQVVAEGGSIAEAAKMLDNVDVAIIDLTLPDGTGTEIIRRLRAQNPEAVSMLLTASDDRLSLARALEAGASGAMHKSASIQELVEAIRKLSIGEPLHTPKEIIELFQYAGRYRDTDQQMRSRMHRLTSRERQILQALADGLSDQEIAQQLSITVRTVQTHVANLLDKLGVDSRLQALVQAARFGMVNIRKAA